MRFARIVVVLALLAQTARAEVTTIVTGYQNGLTYLPLMVMQEQKLVEKHAKAQGLGELKTEWRTFNGPAPINDGILSGNVHFGGVGAPSVVTLWAKTRKSLAVKLVGSLSYMPMYLNTNNDAVRSVKDFTDKDRIATPSVKVGVQSVTLQMAVAQAYGDAHYTKLDKLTVGMGHPEAFIALMSGKSEITAHFGGPPFQNQELEQGKGKVRTILKSYDVLGGKSTFTGVVATDQFRTENPRAYAAYVAAFEEATAYINKNKSGAADVYQKVANAKEPRELIMSLLNDQENEFNLTPRNVAKYADFMQRVGTIKEKLADWKDLTHPNLHAHAGS